MTKTCTVHVKPGSKKGPLLEENSDGSLTVFIRERAVDGKANEAAVKLLAKYFDVPKTKIQIIRGHTFRTKTVHVDN